MLSNLTSPNFEKELIRSPFTEATKSASIRMSNDIIQKIDNILTTAYMTSITAKSLSNDLHVCEKQINRYILSQYSQTFLQRKTMIRINVACEMLTNTDISIAEISAKVGYTSINTFYSAFKNQIGITPNEFRIHSQNNIHKGE
jgi:AraC-like DNA-binding protein